MKERRPERAGHNEGTVADIQQRREEVVIPPEDALDCAVNRAVPEVK